MDKDKNTNIKSPSESLAKKIDSITNSITQAFCPKYRKFTNFDKQTNFQSKQVPPKQQTEQPCQQSDAQEQVENQYATSIPILKHQHKNSQTVSMIDINESTRIPPLDDKKLSIKIQSLSKQRSVNQSSPFSPLPNLKLRKQFTKVRYREVQLTEDQLKYQIKDHFNQLNSIIEKTSTHFEKRMKTHEDQLLKIMMMEIKRVNEECQKTITKYNYLIKLKATSQQIEQARIQTMFFRSQALEFRKQNQDLKKEIKYLKRLNNEYELKIKTDSDALKQMGIKLMSYKEKNKTIQKTLLDQVISKKTQKLKQLSSEKQTYLKVSPNQFSMLQGSKISCLQKVNSKSLDNTDLTEFRTGQKSLTSMRMRTQFGSGASSNPSLTKSMVMKLNREINKKYKIGNQVQQFCASSPTNKNQSLTEITQSNGVVDADGNREKIMRFLKEARPSIKSIIQQKKTIDKKPMRKLTHEPNQKELDNIIVIKNRVRLSTFEQQRWQELKNNSIDLSVENQTSERAN